MCLLLVFSRNENGCTKLQDFRVWLLTHRANVAPLVSRKTKCWSVDQLLSPHETRGHQPRWARNMTVSLNKKKMKRHLAFHRRPHRGVPVRPPATRLAPVSDSFCLLALGWAVPNLGVSCCCPGYAYGTTGTIEASGSVSDATNAALFYRIHRHRQIKKKDRLRENNKFMRK